MWRPAGPARRRGGQCFISIDADQDIGRERLDGRDNGRAARIRSDLRGLGAVVNRDARAMINEIAQPLIDQRPGCGVTIGVITGNAIPFGIL
jgi:hypothetical protein